MREKHCSQLEIYDRLRAREQAESREAVACIDADPGAAAAPKARTRTAASERIGGHAAPKASYQQSSTRA